MLARLVFLINLIAFLLFESKFLFKLVQFFGVCLSPVAIKVVNFSLKHQHLLFVHQLFLIKVGLVLVHLSLLYLQVLLQRFHVFLDQLVFVLLNSYLRGMLDRGLLLSLLAVFKNYLNQLLIYNVARNALPNEITSNPAQLNTQI